MNTIAPATFFAAIKNSGKRLAVADKVVGDTEYWFINGTQFARQVGAFTCATTYWSN